MVAGDTCVQEVREMLRSEVDTLLNKISEAENVAEAVRADLSPDIATVQDGIERWGRDEVGKLGGDGYSLACMTVAVWP